MMMSRERSREIVRDCDEILGDCVGDCERLWVLHARAHHGALFSPHRCAALAQEMSREVYEIVIQAVVDSKVVARETLKATRKNVTAKCSGGDVTRKKKLLEKQKEGKKRSALTVGGNISIPQEAFVAVLSPEKRKQVKTKK